MAKPALNGSDNQGVYDGFMIRVIIVFGGLYEPKEPEKAGNLMTHDRRQHCSGGATVGRKRFARKICERHWKKNNDLQRQ